MTLPTRQERTDAQFALLTLAEHLSGTSDFATALITARGALPDAAAIVDAFYSAPRPTRRPAPTSVVRHSTHHYIVALAEKAQVADPTLTAERAYLQQLQAHPELRHQLADEGHDRDQELMLSEKARAGRVRFGEQRLTKRPEPAPPATDTGDGASHTAWSARASELFKSGRKVNARPASWQECYGMAMEGR